MQATTSDPQERFMAVLREHGWTPDPKFPARSASKAFHTRVGEKTACVILGSTREGTGILAAGSYWSEGRNALEPCGPFPHDRTTIEEQAHAFALDAQERIEGTYAMRLMAGAPREAHAA